MSKLKAMLTTNNPTRNNKSVHFNPNAVSHASKYSHSLSLNTTMQLPSAAARSTKNAQVTENFLNSDIMPKPKSMENTQTLLMSTMGSVKPYPKDGESDH